MKHISKVSLTVLGILFFCLSIGLTSCSKDLFPNGKETKKAYKESLKRHASPYKKMTPIKIDLKDKKTEQWVAPSPNFNNRTPVLVVIHHTAQKNCLRSVRTLTNEKPRGPVSSHYLICKDGTLYQLVDESYRAWHAGLSSWGNITNINSISLGIELDNDGSEPFPEAQIETLMSLLKSMKDRYNIPTGNFVGHGDIAPGRKQDPNIFFPWDELAEEGYGYRLDENLVPPPEGFDPIAALRLIGYNVKNSSAAVISFKRHFIQEDLLPDLNEDDKEAIYNIYLKYLLRE